ncbi:MAG TPA: DUF2239 family protein [Rhodanobacter sp.]
MPREVTLLPRHWDWLAQQPGGAAAVLRQLVERAVRGNEAEQRAHASNESADRFMQVMAGELPGHQEASRAFYRGARAAFAKRIAGWPRDVRGHLQCLAAIAWDKQADAA